MVLSTPSQDALTPTPFTSNALESDNPAVQHPAVAEQDAELIVVGAPGHSMTHWPLLARCRPGRATRPPGRSRSSNGIFVSSWPTQNGCPGTAKVPAPDGASGLRRPQPSAGDQDGPVGQVHDLVGHAAEQ